NLATAMVLSTRSLRSIQLIISASSSFASTRSCGVSYRAIRGQSEFAIVEETRSKSSSPSRMCQLESEWNQGDEEKWSRLNHAANVVPICSEGGRVLDSAVSASRTAEPMAIPRRGGTALPICRNAADGGPAKRNQSGNV